MWSYDEVLARLIARLCEILETDEITAETKWDELALDSLDQVEFVMEIEETFSNSIEPRDVKENTTVAEIARWIWESQR